MLSFPCVFETGSAFPAIGEASPVLKSQETRYAPYQCVLSIQTAKLYIIPVCMT